LESSDINRPQLPDGAGHGAKAKQTSFFGALEKDSVTETIRNLNIDKLTPIEALNTLYDLYIRIRVEQEA
jgi:hypothetical protein